MLKKGEFFIMILACSKFLYFPHPTHSHFPPPTLNPSPPLTLSMGPLYMFLYDPAPSFPHNPSPLSLLVTASLFFISMSLVTFCLLICFVGQVPLIVEIIWYLPFTIWLTSLSIMLSSSIHALTKGRSSFCCVVLHHVNVPQFFDTVLEQQLKNTKRKCQFLKTFYF